MQESPDERGGPPVPEPLKRFIWDIQSMVELADSEREILVIGRDLMRRLVASDGWLPQVFVNAGSGEVQQFQLYHDDLERFTVVSTVLAGGQAMPVTDSRMWEISGVLQGAVERTCFAWPPDGKPQPSGAPMVMQRGAVETRPANGGEGLQLRNPQAGETAVCIHVYGGEISQLPRRTLSADGAVSEVPTVYANAPTAPPYDILSIQTRIAD